LLVGVNRNTATLFYHKLREVIAAQLEAEAPEMFCGEVELDESYFGGKRKGKRGRGAAGKVPVFGLLKRGGRVYTMVISNAASNTLLPIIKERVKPDSIVYTDTFAAYDVLDVTGFKHHRVNHSKHFVERGNHINGIENFWNQAKRHLRRYNGIPRAHFEVVPEIWTG
jgi:transposase